MKYLALGITLIIAIVIGTLTTDYIRLKAVDRALEQAKHEAHLKLTEERAKQQRELAQSQAEARRKQNEAEQKKRSIEAAQTRHMASIEQKKAQEQEKIKVQYELEKAFEAQFKSELNCNVYFVECVDEKRNAKIKYLADHGFYIDLDKKLQTLVKKNTNYAKTAQEAKNELIGVNQILKNMENNNSIRKQNNETCKYWIKNQDGSEIKKGYKKQACGY